MARLKKKLSTQELLYVSIRNELAAKKDRLRTQQEEIERLRALRVSLLDTPTEAESLGDPLPAPAEDAGQTV